MASRPIAPAPSSAQAVPISIPQASHHIFGSKLSGVVALETTGQSAASLNIPTMQTVSAAAAQQPPVARSSQHIQQGAHPTQQPSGINIAALGPQASGVSLIKHSHGNSQDLRPHANVLHLPHSLMNSGVTAPKRSVAAAVLRNQVPQATIGGMLQARQLPASVRPTTPITPPVTRPGSPSVNLSGGGGQPINQEALRSQLVQNAPTTATTVQITITQPRDMSARQTLITQLPTKSTLSQPAQLMQPHAPKVIVTQAPINQMMQSQGFNSKTGVGQQMHLGTSTNRQRLVIPQIPTGHNALVQAKQQQPVSSLQLPSKVIIPQQGALSQISQRAIKVTGGQKIGGPQGGVVTSVPRSHKVMTQVMPNVQLGKGPVAASVSTHGPSLCTGSSLSAGSAVPIAKVTPTHRQYQQQQQATELVNRDGGVQAGGQLAATVHSGAYLPPAHRNSPAPAATAHAAATVSLSQERRPAVYGPMFPNAVDSSTSVTSSFLTYQNMLAQCSSSSGSRQSVPSQSLASHPSLTAQSAAGRVLLSPFLANNMDQQPRSSQLTERTVPPPQPPVGVNSEGGATASASSAIAASKQAQLGAPPTGGSGQNTQPSPGGANPNQSPRPSILRKRNNDGMAQSVVRKNLMSSLMSGGEPDASCRVPNAMDPSRDNSQSSTDTATSSDSALSTELRLKDGDVMGDVPPINGGLHTPGKRMALSTTPTSSPRKKPRKQLLQASTDFREHSDSGTDEEMEKIAESVPEPNSKLEEVHQALLNEDDEGVRWIAERRRPQISLLNNYQIGWKTKQNHFLRYQDVKPKEERRLTVNELANQKHVVQKASGWKLYHLAAQFEEMIKAEKELNDQMTSIREVLTSSYARTNMRDDAHQVTELLQDNTSRCELVQNQLEEAKANMLQVLDHKTKVMEIINKNRSKRPLKKKER